MQLLLTQFFSFTFFKPELSTRRRVSLRVASASHRFPACHRPRLASRGTDIACVCIVASQFFGVSLATGASLRPSTCRRWRRRVWPVAAACLAAGVSTQSAAPRHAPHWRSPGYRYAPVYVCHGGHMYGHCVSLRTCLCHPSSARRVDNSEQYTFPLNWRSFFWLCLGRASSLSRTLGENLLKSRTRPNL